MTDNADPLPRRWTGDHPDGGRTDIYGVVWFACDPYPTWYRHENGKLITHDRPKFPKDNEAEAGVRSTVDLVNHPPHYKHASGIQCIEVTRQCHGDLSAAIQYIWRYADKGRPVEDLRKARWYLRDILANGLCSFPPHKAKYLLHQVIAAETDQLRKYLLARILDGQLDMAIDAITEFVGSDD